MFNDAIKLAYDHHNNPSDPFYSQLMELLKKAVCYFVSFIYFLTIYQPGYKTGNEADATTKQQWT